MIVGITIKLMCINFDFESPLSWHSEVDNDSGIGSITYLPTNTI